MNPRTLPALVLAVCAAILTACAATSTVPDDTVTPTATPSPTANATPTASLSPTVDPVTALATQPAEARTLIINQPADLDTGHYALTVGPAVITGVFRPIQAEAALSPTFGTPAGINLNAPDGTWLAAIAPIVNVAVDDPDADDFGHMGFADVPDDLDAMRDWLASDQPYYQQISRITDTTVGGRPAIAFDVTADPAFDDVDTTRSHATLFITAIDTERHTSAGTPIGTSERYWVLTTPQSGWWFASVALDAAGTPVYDIDPTIDTLTITPS